MNFGTAYRIRTVLNLVPRSLVDEAEGEICKVRKFVFLDWLLRLTPVQSPL